MFNMFNTKKVTHAERLNQAKQEFLQHCLCLYDAGHSLRTLVRAERKEE